MFNKLKQFKDLRDKAKTMQSALAEETIDQERNGIKISLNGNLEITSVKLNSELNQSEQENSLKSCLNEAIKKAQKIMAKKMQDMGGFSGLG